MPFFSFFKRSDKGLKVLTKKELNIVTNSISLRLDKFLTPELILLNSNETGIYGFVISFEVSELITSIGNSNAPIEQTWLLTKTNTKEFVFDLILPYYSSDKKIGIPKKFVYQIIENAVNWYPESYSYEEFAKACVICATPFVQERVIPEKKGEEKFEFPIEYYLETYGPANDRQKSLFLQAKKEYKDFSPSHGSPSSENLLEELVALNPNFASAQFFLGLVRVQNWDTRKIHLELFEKWSKKDIAEKEDEVLYKSSLNFDKAIALNPYYKLEILKLQRQGKI